MGLVDDDQDRLLQIARCALDEPEMERWFTSEHG